MTKEEAVNRFKGIKKSFSISIAQSKFYPSKVILDELCDMAIEALKDRPSEYNTISIANEPYTTEYAKGYNDAKREIALSGEYERVYQRGKADAIEALQTEAVEIVRCKECKHTSECQKIVQYTRHEQNTVSIGYLPIEWCSRGERRTR